MPADVRARYEQAMRSLKDQDANRNGIPDFVEGMLGAHGGMSHVANNQTNHTLHHAPRTPIPVSPAITPDTSNGWMLALLGAFLLFLCAAGALGVWYFLFR